MTYQNRNRNRTVSHNNANYTNSHCNNLDFTTPLLIPKVEITTKKVMTKPLPTNLGTLTMTDKETATVIFNGTSGQGYVALYGQIILYSF